MKIRIRLKIKIFKMKQLFLLVILSAGLLISSCGEKLVKAKIETSYGDIVVELFNTTPLHRDNFVKLVKDDFYEDQLFHRVINDFMVQGGDPQSKGATQDRMLGSGGPGYTIPAEIQHFHFRGSLAAARRGGPANPDKESSGSQFYIVHGKKLLQEVELKMAAGRNGQVYTPEDIEKYLEKGGYPSLDNEYTVFGQVIEGMEVVDEIARVRTKGADRPIEDIKMKIRIIR
jgi:cyclophilin family peptidyl-prolyl cis-trans isomerase